MRYLMKQKPRRATFAAASVMCNIVCSNDKLTQENEPYEIRKRGRTSWCGGLAGRVRVGT